MAATAHERAGQGYKVHYNTRIQTDPDPKPACNRYLDWATPAKRFTRTLSHVTCGACKKTTLYKDAVKAGKRGPKPKSKTEAPEKAKVRRGPRL